MFLLSCVCKLDCKIIKQAIDFQVAVAYILLISIFKKQMLVTLTIAISYKRQS